MSGPDRPSPENAVKVGYIRRAHGIKGAVIVRIFGDEFDQYRTGRVLLSDHPGQMELTVAAAHPHRDGWLVTFEELSTRNEAEEVRGTSLFIDIAERRDLDEDEYWPEQLVGMQVADLAGHQLGVVEDLILGDAQDRLVVTAGDTRVEVPFVRAIVTAISLTEGIVTLDPPGGLFPD